jgi:hypothetical protein
MQPTPLRVEQDRAFFESWIRLDCFSESIGAAQLNGKPLDGPSGR